MSTTVSGFPDSVCIFKRGYLAAPNSMAYLSFNKFGMSTPEIKKLLIDKIKATDDKAILEEVLRLLDLEFSDNEPYNLSPEQLHIVQEARTEIKVGKSQPKKDADDEVKRWLET